MVIRMLCIIALLLFGVTHAGAQRLPDSELLSVEVSKAEKQWGQYMRVTIHYSGSRALQDINLDEWRELAEIQVNDEYRDSDEQGRDIQVMKLRVYPRSVGSIHLPALRLGQAVSSPLELISTNPVVEDSKIELLWSASSSTTWQREAIVIHVRLITGDYAARIKLDPISRQQYLSWNLHLKIRQLADGRYEHQSGWVIYALNAGEQLLSLPAVRYQLSGSDRRRFHLPRQTLNIRPLPSYLPPTLPIGKLNISSNIIGNRDNTSQWHIQLGGRGLIPYGSPGLDRQLADISGHDLSLIEVEPAQSIDVNGVHNVADYYVPLPRWMMPLGPDRSVNVRFFDTVRGRLVSQSHTLPRQINMPAWAWYISYAFLIMTVAIALYGMKNYLVRYLDLMRLKMKIRQAEDAREIRAAILSHGHCPTLTHWSSNRENRKIVAGEIDRHCFSRGPRPSVEPLRKKLLMVL